MSCPDPDPAAKSRRYQIGCPDPTPTRTVTSDLRDRLGRRVREVWIACARQLPDPKPSHLLPWENLDEWNKEVDRRIGEALYKEGFQAAGDAGKADLHPRSLPADIAMENRWRYGRPGGLDLETLSAYFRAEVTEIRPGVLAVGDFEIHLNAGGTPKSMRRPVTDAEG